jgi:DNA invertase Pin-like site-specific DNA recombinase
LRTDQDHLLKSRPVVGTLNLGADTGTPASKPVYAIIAAMAEMEIELLVEHTMSGLAAAHTRGRNGGRGLAEHGQELSDSNDA